MYPKIIGYDEYGNIIKLSTWHLINGKWHYIEQDWENMQIFINGEEEEKT